MADDTRLNPGASGDLIRTDDDGVAKHQVVKQEWGADGSFNMVDDADGKRLPIKPHMAGTGTRTQVNDSAVAVEILAANTNRKGAVITNTSSADLFIGLGATDPTVTNYTARLPQNAAWEVPACFSGQIKGIWASDPGDGVANVTELT